MSKKYPYDNLKLTCSLLKTGYLQLIKICTIKPIIANQLQSSRFINFAGTHKKQQRVSKL